MDYKRFIEKIGEEMDVPDDEQILSLVEGNDTIHIQVIIGYALITGEQVTLPFVVNGDKFVDALDTLNERGAIRGDDYLLCAPIKQGRIMATIHTKSTWICEEDII